MQSYAHTPDRGRRLLPRRRRRSRTATGPWGSCLACGYRCEAAAPCSECGFEWLAGSDPPFDYVSGYDESVPYNAMPADALLDHYRSAANTGWALRELGQAQRSESRLVEFGSSQGAFLALAKLQGYAVLGFEPSEASVRYGVERLGLTAQELQHGYAGLRHPDQEPAQVVCAFEVLEHADDPVGFLGVCASWLEPSGRLLLSVPNGRRLSVRLGRRELEDHPPHHLSRWTVNALSRMLGRVGFQVDEIFTSPLTRSDVGHGFVPKLLDRRAATTGALRPILSPASAKPIPTQFQPAYRVLAGATEGVARLIGLVPEMGSTIRASCRVSKDLAIPEGARHEGP